MFPKHSRQVAFLAVSALLGVWTLALATRERAAYASWTDAQADSAPSTTTGAHGSVSAQRVFGPVAEEPSSCPPGESLPGATGPQASTVQPAVGPSANGGANTFRLCTPPDPQIARAIEQLIAGRSFSATLVARNADCPELTIAVSPGGAVNGRQVSKLSVGLGSGDRLAVEIASENGSTTVDIGVGR